jgi:hypothetical protein
MSTTAGGLSDKKAARMMTALRQGQTLRKFGIKADRLDEYFRANPAYANEARPLIYANKEAARLRRGDGARTTTHCRAGLHLMVGDNVYFDGTNGRKRCRACRRISSARGSLPPPEIVEKVKLALERGVTIGEITHGMPTGGGKRNGSLCIASYKGLRRYRQENLEFDRFVRDATKDNNRRGQILRYQRERNAKTREQNNDYYKIVAMTPSYLPPDVRDDVAQSIFVALLEGSLRRDQVHSRIREFVTAHYRLFSSRYAKFGDSPLLSLDEAVFDDGSGKRGDSVSQGLWD